MRKKLKICHIITRMIVGGAQENTLLTIMDHIAKGHEVILISGPSPGPEGELLKNKNIPEFEKIIVADMVREISPWQDLRAYRELKTLLLKLNPDVVHTHSSKAGIVGRAAASAAGVPFICHTVHGQAFHPYQSCLKNRLYILAERWAARRCHKIYAVADAMIKQCVAAQVAAESKYKTVYSGMELEEFINARPNNDLRRELNIPAGAPVVCTVARLFPLKGYEYLIEAAEIISKNRADTYFLVVGDGILLEQIKAESRQKNLNFVFAGLVAPNAVPKYIALSDLMIHLSLREGLPRAIVQALANAKPAIGFALDGTPEVLIRDKTGLAADPGNAAEVAEFALKLINQPELRRQLGKNGQDLVREKFSWRRMGDILEQEYCQGLSIHDKNQH